jgi:hypothetical protein
VASSRHLMCQCQQHSPVQCEVHTQLQCVQSLSWVGKGVPFKPLLLFQHDAGCLEGCARVLPRLLVVPWYAGWASCQVEVQG